MDSGAIKRFQSDSPEQILVAHYDGPAMLVDVDGVCICNDDAIVIMPKLYNVDAHDASTLDVGEELLRLAKKAHDDGHVAVASLVFPGTVGTSIYHTTFVPRVLGKWVLCLLRDRTLEHNLREALIESRQRFKDLVEVSSDFSWEVDAAGYFQFVSRTGALGYAPEALVGKRPQELIIDAEEFDPVPFLSTEVIENIELWMRRGNGGMSCVQVSAVPFFEEDGKYLGTRGVCRDVTLERERANALAQAHQREQVLSYIVNAIRDEINPQNMLGAAAAATARALGAEGCSVLRKIEPEDSTDDKEGTPAGYIMAARYGEHKPPSYDDGILSFEAGERLIHEQQIDGWNILAGPCVHAGVLKGVICLWRRESWLDDARLLVGDIANQLGIAIEQIVNHEHVLRLSRTDAMTGLLNRRAFYDEELPRRFRRLARDGQTAALFYVDMDNFKLVNDRRGHQAGDEAIFALREILHNFVRPGDLIARLGGDEFALWLDGVNEQTAAKRCEDLLHASQALKIYSGDDALVLGISVGVAVYRPNTHESLDSLIARADAAMYEVKQNHKGDYCMAAPYDPVATGAR